MVVTPNWTPDEEERLRRALREEASKVLPSGDGLERIRERTSKVPFWRRPVVLGVVAATAVSVVAIAAVSQLLGSPAEDTTLSPGATTAVPTPTEATTEATPPDEGTATPSPEAEPDSAEIVTVPVYYLSDTPAGPRLAREFRAVAEQGTVAETAVATMLVAPVDPDYRTPWPAEVELRSVEIRDGAIKVDLDVPAGAADQGRVPADEADLAVQQLVYTVTGAMNQAGVDAPPHVRVLVDGEEIEALWGADVSRAVDRADWREVRQFVQINDPTEGATMDRPAVFRGEAAAFEATLEWRIESVDGTLVAENFTTTEEGQTFAPFEFEVDLEPGDYVITISETDPSDGEGRGVMSDTRRFTVTDD
jgi:hypothetical protein